MLALCPAYRLLALLFSVGLLAVSAQANLLVEDSFNYSLTNGATMHGVAVNGTGLTGNWGVSSAGGGSSTYVTNGLTFGSNFFATTGGALRTFAASTNTNSFSIAGAQLNAGTQTGTLWNSYLWNVVASATNVLNPASTHRINTTSTTQGGTTSYFQSLIDHSWNDTNFAIARQPGITYTNSPSGQVSPAVPATPYSVNTTYLTVTRWTGVGQTLSATNPGVGNLWIFDLNGYDNWRLAGSLESELSTYATWTAVTTNTSGTWTFGNDRFVQFTSFVALNQPAFDARYDEMRWGTTLDSVAVPFLRRYWTADGTALGGEGTWNSNSNNWSMSSSTVAGAPWDGNYTATFRDNPATVSVANITASRGLVFETSDYTLASGTITLDAASAAANTITTDDGVTATIGSVLAGSNGLSKAGNGTLVLTGTNTYSGGTTLREGTLVVNGIVNGAMTVEAGGTLSGTGTVSGPANIAGTLRPGSGPGTQTFSKSLTVDGATVEWELTENASGDRGTDYVGIEVASILDFAAPTTLVVQFKGTVDWDDEFWDAERTGTGGWRIIQAGAPILRPENLRLEVVPIDSRGGTLVRGRGEFTLHHDAVSHAFYLQYRRPAGPGTSLGIR